MTSRHDGTLHTLASVAAARWRISIALTMVMVAVYVGFILLVAYSKPVMGLQLLPGVSVGMLLGVLVIVAAWVVTWIYVVWANTHHDAAVTGLRR